MSWLGFRCEVEPCQRYIDLANHASFTSGMRIWMWMLICVAGLAVSGCFLHHKETAQYTPVPGLVAEPTNEPTVTIVSNTPPPAVQESKPVPTVAVTNNAPTNTPAVASVPTENPAPVAAPTPPHPSVTETNATRPIATPAQGLTGKVASVNPTGKFVVLSFPIGQMPAFDQTLNLYRKGIKVAEVKVTGPKLDDNIVADLAQGSAEVGDDVRDR